MAKLGIEGIVQGEAGGAWVGGESTDWKEGWSCGCYLPIWTQTAWGQNGLKNI